MSAVDFGLMLRATQPYASISEVHQFNLGCIHTLSSGFTTLWLEDHLQWGETDVLECLTTLSFLAGQFPRFRLGTLVLAQAYRNPALLAKMVANLQFLTGNRFILGLGAGWKEDEYLAYGYPFPTTATRFDQLEEAIQLIHSMWGSQPATFVGEYYKLQNAYCKPQPLHTIPLLIGGGGEQRTLSLVAQYAGWWNYNSCTVEEYARKLSILASHCHSIGRDIAEIRLTYLSTISVAEDPTQVVRHPQKHYLAGNAAEVIRELEQFCEIGVTHFMFRALDIPTLKHFAETVVPHFM